MFGHGQIEGFEEKYGMEYRRSYKDEKPDGYLIGRHEYEIFPLMKRRYLFSGSENFRLFDLYCDGGSVNENVFAYTNRSWANGYEEKALIFFNNSYYETSGWIKASDPAIPDGKGGTRRDSLSEALTIHGDSKYFTLLREQKSNLWFIRSSKAICEDGFFVCLKGYETQAYMDVYEVEDDAKGRWARLNNDLNGGGVPCPYAAIKDIFLGELYYRFMEVLKPENINDLKDSVSKKSFVDSLKAPVETFAKTAANFITGANGSYDPWTAHLQEAGEKTKDGKSATIKFTAVKTDVIWKEFEAFLGRTKEVMGIIKKTKTPLLAKIADNISKRQMLNAVILSYGLVSILRSVIGKEATGKHAAALAFDHWDLGRKLRELYVRFGASEHEAWKISEIAKASLSRIPASLDSGSLKTGIKLSPSDLAALIIEENYTDEDFRRILGINFYNDVPWFNKEGFDDALFYASLFFMIESSIVMPTEAKVNCISSLYDVLVKAEAKSEYRFDTLVDILTAKPKKARTAGSKTQTKGLVAKAGSTVKAKPATVKKPAAKAKPRTTGSAATKSKVAVKTPAKKAKPKKATTKKPATAKKATKPKTAAKKPSAKKAPVKKAATAKKPAAKKAVVKKSATTKKTTAKKPKAKTKKK